MTEQVTRVRAGVATGDYDEQGNPVAGASSEVELEILAFAPQVSDETAEAFGAQVISAGTVYAERGIDIRPADRLVIRGTTWQVEGHAKDWLSPYAMARSGVEVLVRRVS